LILSSLLLFILARYVADMLYISAYERILPSLYGAASLLLVIGSVLWVIFLSFSGLELQYSIYAYILFCEALMVWIQINYITALKEYRTILAGFFVGILAGLLCGYILVRLNYDVVASMLAGACIAYGLLILDFTFALHRFFPIGSGSPLKFLEWFDEYPHLIFIGFLSMVGLFGHIMIMWMGPWGESVTGLFYDAPQYDIPAFFAFITCLVTTVNFVTSVEVNFYPKYRLYFSLLNEKGSLSDIEKAYEDMMTVLKQELLHLAIIQIFVTVFSIIIIGEILVYLPLGFTSVMIGTFRILCVGYAAYAIGNSFMLLLLYFASYEDALWSVLAFALISILGTYYTLSLPDSFYGFGFVAAGLIFYLIADLRLFAYTARLDFFILTKQPVFFDRKRGFFTWLVSKLEKNHKPGPAETHLVQATN
jgi:uncharacterized membrane protein